MPTIWRCATGTSQHVASNCEDLAFQRMGVGFCGRSAPCIIKRT
jgi:hypothetical protein